MPYKNIEDKREYQREWKAARRRKYLNGKLCNDCGSKLDLEIHHRNPKTKISHKIWSWKISRLEEELAKCDIICNECHKHKPRT